MSEPILPVFSESVSETLKSNHVPEIMLIIMGVIALVIVWMYLKDKESGKYKLTVLIGVILGILMAVFCASVDNFADKGTLIIVIVACFALIIRPFRDVHFAVIIALFVMILAYVSLGGLTGNLEFLSQNPTRIIAAFVIGAIAYMLLHFLQDLVLLFAKILNAWPILAVLGVICIIEGICVMTGHGSVYDMIKSFIDSQSGKILSLLGLF